MSRDQKAWIPLINYSTKYGVSLSTLRRRIKANTIPFMLENGKYLLLDEEGQIFEDKPQVLVEPIPAAVPAKNTEVGVGGLAQKAPSTPTLDAHNETKQEHIFTTAHRLVEELKSAYSKILGQQEEQIGLLKEEVADLRTLVRVLEDQLFAKRQTPSSSDTGRDSEDAFQMTGGASDLLDLHEGYERRREKGPPLSNRWTQAISESEETANLFKQSLNTEGPGLEIANGALSASRSSVVGVNEEYFFDSSDEVPALDGSNSPMSEKLELDFNL